AFWAADRFLLPPFLPLGLFTLAPKSKDVSNVLLAMTAPRSLSGLPLPGPGSPGPGDALCHATGLRKKGKHTRGPRPRSAHDERVGWPALQPRKVFSLPPFPLATHAAASQVRVHGPRVTAVPLRQPLKAACRTAARFDGGARGDVPRRPRA